MASFTVEVTVKDLVQERLEALDKAWARIRAIHADITHTNVGSKEYREAMEQLEKAMKACWRLKEAWSDHDES